MSVEIIETATHVFRIEMTPDDEGDIRREYRIEVLSGPKLTDQQWGRLKEWVVREMIANGAQVYRVGVIRKRREGESP